MRNNTLRLRSPEAYMQDPPPVAIQPVNLLLTALDERWRISEPVYRGLCDDDGCLNTDYYFVLKRDAAVDMLIVPGSEEVRRFLRDRRLQTVDAFRVVNDPD